MIFYWAAVILQWHGGEEEDLSQLTVLKGKDLGFLENKVQRNR